MFLITLLYLVVQTLWCGNGIDGQLIQVTSTEVRLVGKSHDVLDTWHPPQNAAITVATGNSRQISVATNDGLLIYIEVLQSSIAVAQTLRVEFEVSCLDMTPLGTIRGLEKEKA